jgi:hypothetical protein
MLTAISRRRATSLHMAHLIGTLEAHSRNFVFIGRVQRPELHSSPRRNREDVENVHSRGRWFSIPFVTSSGSIQCTALFPNLNRTRQQKEYISLPANVLDPFHLARPVVKINYHMLILCGQRLKMWSMIASRRRRWSCTLARWHSSTIR